MKRFHPSLLCLAIAMAAALCGFAGPALAAQAAGAEKKPESAEYRLAQRLCCSALTLLRFQPVSTAALDGASGILKEAVSLAPDDVELWRITLKVADLSEDIELQNRAINEIRRLDPADNVIALRRIIQAVDQKQTIEDRLAYYEQLLSPKRVDALGNAIASRLIFDYALLLRREGRISAFGEQLARAVAIDSSNTAAASFAAGYFHANVNDSYAEVELLVNLLMADPTLEDIQAAIARLALDNGAYDAAVRMYQLFTNSRLAQGAAVNNSIVADHAVALWGAGRPEEALRLLDGRQTMLNMLERSRVLKQDKEKTPLDVAGVDAESPVGLASVRAAILDRLRDPLAGQTRQAMMQTFEKAIVAARNSPNPPTPQQFALSYLELAMLCLWMSCEADRAENYIQQAVAIEPLSDSASARFQGWMELCRGNLEEAAAQFAACAEDDTAAKMGMAMVHLRNGEKADAARNFLAVARKQPGTIMGVWCAQMLFSIVGQPAPLSDQAKRINELIASIPPYVDRYPNRPTELVSMRITAPVSHITSFDPIELQIEIVNNALFPLEISPTGPIRPQVTILPSVRVLQQGTLPPIDIIFFDIDRRLRLEPRGRVVIPVDLRRHPVGSVLQSYLLPGAFVQCELIWNYKFSDAGRLEPGLLGGRTQSLNFRMEGERVDYAWIERALQNIEIVDRPQDVNQLIQLTHLSPIELSTIPADVRQQLKEQLPPKLLAAYQQLDATRQALVLAEMGLAEQSVPILQSAVSQDNRLIRMTYLLNCVRDMRDPIIEVCKRADDPLLNDIATQLEYVATQTAMQEAQRRAQQNAATPSGTQP